MSDDYHEMRRLLKSNKIVGISGCGATDQVISEAERVLGLRFPPSDRMFLKEFGWGYFGHMELLVGLGSDIPEEWRPGANLVQVTQRERQASLFTNLSLIPIYTNGSGDWYALDFSQANGEEVPVVFLSHEEAATRQALPHRCADSFGNWIISNLS